MSWFAISVLAPILLVIYLLVTDFVDLYPYNDVSKHTKEVRQKELINYILPLIAAFMAYLDMGITLLIAFAIAAIFLYGHIYWWWKPYFFGTTEERKKRWKEKFGRTIFILPKIKDHPIPNLEHLPVGILVVIWFMASLLILI